jgi:hypothetical protein
MGGNMRRELKNTSLSWMLGPLCLLAALTAVLAPSAIARSDNRDADTFSGSCHFSGTLLFEPPLRTEPQAVHTSAIAEGPCEGTFTNQHRRSRTLSGDLVRYSVEASGQISCGPGGENTGIGFMQFGRERLYFSFSEVRELGSATLSLQGFDSGSAAGQGSVSAQEDPVVLANRCMNEGLSQVRVDIDIATTPSVSG